MEKNNKEMNEIKIILLEIKPPLKELEKNNNEISIIFQGINVFYNLGKLITNNTEILINNCKNSVIISLVKSDNIFASTVFNIRSGERWVSFNYENKKKSTIKSSINNIDRIKIKIFCHQEKNSDKNIINDHNKSESNSKNSNIINDIKINQTKKRYHKNNNKNKNELNNKLFNNNEIKNHNRYDSIITDNNNSINVNKLYTNTPIINKCNIKTHRKKNSDMSLQTRNEVNKSNYSNFQNSEYSLITFHHPKINTSSSYTSKNYLKNNLTRFHSYRASHKNKTIIRTQTYGIQNLNKYLDGYSGSINNHKTEKNTMPKNNNKINSSFKNNFYFLNHSPIHNKIFGNNNNSISNREYKDNPLYGINKNSKNNIINSLNVNKNRQIIKNRLFKNNIQGNVTNSYSTATTKKNEFEGSLNSLQDNEEKINDKKINKKYKFPLTTNRQKNKIISSNFESKSQFQILLGNNENNHKEKINNFKISNNLENIILQNNMDKDKCVNKEENEENDITILKSDIELFCDKGYIYNIKNDLLKLEIEIFVEKMMELISVYHKEIELKIYENKIAKNVYKENSKKYITFYKLINKLQLIKDKYEAKQIDLNNNKKSIKQQKNNNLLLNKEEFTIFGELINNKNLCEHLNRNNNLKSIFNRILKNDKLFLYNGKYKEWLQLKIFNVNNTFDNNNNIYNRKIRTKVIPKKQHNKISSNINNNDSKNNNILFNNFIKEGIYIKKGPKSPLYSSKKIKSNKIFI